MTSDISFKIATVAALRAVLKDVDSACEETQALEEQVDDLLHKSQTLSREFAEMVKRTHSLSNRFVKLQEDTMQIIDDATGVLHDDD